MANIVVWVTCPSARAADRIGRALVEERLAACVNLLPLTRSIYRWKGKVETARETLLMIKTSRSAFQRLRARVKALHPHAVPEIIATSIVAGDPPYLAWIRDSVIG